MLHPWSAASSGDVIRFDAYNKNSVQVSEDGRTAIALLEMVPCAALGSEIFSQNVNEWLVTIDVSRMNYGGALCIGVTDADAEFTDEKGGASWGFNPFSGCLMSTDNAYNVDYNQLGKSLMQGDLQMKSQGASIVITVDMNTRKLYFSINSGLEICADIELPPRVRPWVHLFKERDALRIGPCQTNSEPPKLWTKMDASP